MKVLLVLALIVAATAFERSNEWEDWKKMYGKEYKNQEEELQRMMIWNTNKQYVEQHNSNVELYGYTTSTNEFSDLDSAEFSKMVNGYRYTEKKRGNRPVFVPTVSVDDLPATVDWRTKGYVTPVKNQGQCGSCWSFSTTGSVEGQHFNATGRLVSLSEQNLMDCSVPEGDHSCEGGLMDDAFEYIIKTGGIDTETSYPYQAHDERCRYNPGNSGATISSFVDVATRNEADLQVAVATVGPISVAIDASRGSFQLYREGVYYSMFCSQTSLDHGVLVVGYGTEDGKDYWLVKNSWGASWGMSGYIKMSRNRNNNCGISTDASYPVV